MPQTKKNIYRQLCDKKPIPLFMQAWWMDCVSLVAMLCKTCLGCVLSYSGMGDYNGSMAHYLFRKSFFIDKYYSNPTT
jgi:hypothetical protein